jgi:hypothetical protein
MPTQQETFDRVAAHLLAQGRTAEMVDPLDGETLCAYRTPDGLKCAAGCLIPDELYTPDMERQSIHSDGRAGAVLERLGYNLDLVLSLQAVHDQGVPDNWPKRLRAVAARYKLSTAVLDAPKE